jgi:hypothetical protein
MGMDESGPNVIRLKRRIAVLVIPTWAAFAVELLGGWRFGLDTYSGKYAIDLGVWGHILVSAVLVAVLVSPFLLAYGFVLASKLPSDPEKRKLLRPSLLLLLCLSLAVSTFSCIWTCGGHPTWTGGFN